MTNGSLGFLFFILFFGCAPKEMSIDGLNSYVLDEDNGLKKTIDIDGASVSVTYRPTDLWVHQETNGTPADREVVDSLRKKYSEYYYFIISLARDSKEALHQVGSKGQYGELVQTLSFRMPEYVMLTTSKRDTIPVDDFMLNRTYGLSASTDMLFVFDRTKADGSSWVQFNLNEFGLGLGNQRFRFDTNVLENAPKLNFSN